MSDNANTTKHRGRPKGATSTVEITLADLCEKVGGDMNATIAVGRTWLAKRMTFVAPIVVPTQPPKIAEASEQNDGIPKEIQDQLEEPKIEFSIS